MDSSCVANFIDTPTGKLIVSGDKAGVSGCMLSVVIPTYEEARNIVPTLMAMRASLDAVPGLAYEAIVVDDNSPDETWRIASELAGEYPELRVMRRVGERGLSSAVIRGWQAAQGRVLATINADGQHPPELLSKMVELVETADVVVATRYGAGGSVGEFARHRQVLSNGARLAGELVLPEVFRRVSDPLSGYYMFQRSAIAGIALRPTGFKTLVEVLGRGRVGEVAEVGYRMRERQHGRSNMRLRNWLEYGVQLARLRRELWKRDR